MDTPSYNLGEINDLEMIYPIFLKIFLKALKFQKKKKNVQIKRKIRGKGKKCLKDI